MKSSAGFTRIGVFARPGPPDAASQVDRRRFEMTGRDLEEQRVGRDLLDQNETRPPGVGIRRRPGQSSSERYELSKDVPGKTETRVETLHPQRLRDLPDVRVEHRWPAFLDVTGTA